MLVVGSVHSSRCMSVVWFLLLSQLIVEPAIAIDD